MRDFHISTKLQFKGKPLPVDHGESEIVQRHLAIADKTKEFPDGTSQMTAFIGEQLSICKAFGLEVPAECLPAEEKKAINRKNNPQRPGRKPKGTPAPHKIVPVLIGV